MPKGWSWDETLFRGSASYYIRGRLPYPPGLHDAFAGVADLRGSPRLIDVGCGTGRIALILADLFAEVVGVDPDAEMLAEAERSAADLGVANARWVKRRAEELPDGLGMFRYATFAQSFHWMERERVARTVWAMLEPGGAFVHVNTAVQAKRAQHKTSYPAPPRDAMQQLVERYLGPVRRAGQGFLRHGTPDDEWGVLREAGYLPPMTVPVAGGDHIERDIDDLVAEVFSSSASAPHLFGDRLAAFEEELRALLNDASQSGRFSDVVSDAELVFYRHP